MRNTAKALIGPVATLLLLLGGAVRAEAATGTVGPHRPAEVTCNTDATPRLQAHAPYLRAPYRASSTVVAGPNNIQWAGFRHWLIRWNGTTWVGTDQNRDGAQDRGPLYQAQVTSEEGGPWFPPNTWYNADAKKWQPGITLFSIRDAGYYRVRTQYYWYADAANKQGSDVLDSTHHYNNTGVTMYADPWCQY